MGVAHHLTTIDSTSKATANYWVENLHLSFIVSIKSTRKFECYTVTCYRITFQHDASEYASKYAQVALS